MPLRIRLDVEPSAVSVSPMKKPPAKLTRALDDARALKKANKISKAAQAARQAHDLAVDYLPAGHPSRLETAELLGSLLLILGNREEAEPLLREAGQLEPDAKDEELVAARNNEMALLLGSGVTRDTARKVEEAFEFARQRLPLEHPHCLVAMGNLGKLRLEQEHFREAERLFQDVLASTRRNDAATPLLVDAIQHLAILRLKTGQSEQAEPLWCEAVKLQEGLEPDASVLHGLLNGLATSVGNQGRYEEALELLQRCLALARECVGETHGTTCSYWLAVASTLQTMGRVSEAVDALGGAAYVLEETLGAYHPQTMSLRMEVVKLMITLGPKKAQEALDYLRPVSETIRLSAPAGHPIHQSSKELLRRAEAAAVEPA